MTEQQQYQQLDPEAEQQLLAVLEQFDSNSDHKLSEAELDSAIIDENVRAANAAWAALLKYHFDDIRKEQMPAILRWVEHGVPIKAIANYVLRHGMLTDVQRFSASAKTPKSLYGDTRHPLHGVQPEAVRQGTAGDCYFLAAVASMAMTKPQRIMSMIREQSFNKYLVVFPGAPDEEIAVDKPTDAELMLYSHGGEYGVWVPVLEKAYGLFLMKHGVHKSKIPAQNAHAAKTVYQAIDLLTGNYGQWRVLQEWTQDVLAEELTDAFKEKRIVVAATGGSCDSEVIEHLNIPQAHAYSVLHWDRHQRKMLIRNPWGCGDHCEPTDKRGEPLDGHMDGRFELPLDTFVENFTMLYLEEPKDDDA